MTNSLVKKYSLGSLFVFALPNIIMMVFLSMYIIVDGTFISRYVGTTALSAVTMVYPLTCLEMAIGIMIATGGSAVIAKAMGEGKEDKAKQYFTMLTCVEVLFGIIFAVFGNIFMDRIFHVIGVSAVQYDLAATYLRILLWIAPAFFLQTAFQTFFVTAGKPTLGLIVTVIAGVLNIVLDYIFMAIMELGVSGAAVATGLGYLVAAVSGLIFFCVNKNGLHFCKFKFEKDILLKVCGNGSSEMVTNLANAVTTFLFNYTFMKYYGEDGVASISILIYFQYIFTAIYFGYSNGISPIVSFKYGERNSKELKSLLKYGVIFIIVCSSVAFVIARLIAGTVFQAFAPITSNVYKISMGGFPIHSIGFLLMGISVFASSWFTALSDGKTSAIISFTRTFLLLAIFILVLPQILGTIGIWLAVPLAEGCGVVLSIFYLIKKKGKWVNVGEPLN